MKVFEVDSKIAIKYADMIAKMKDEALSFAKDFSDSTENMSDWGHNYFCKDDGENLIFDLNKPHEHQCKHCHKVYKSELLDNVWTGMYRSTAILNLINLAILYKLEQKDEYMSEYKKILGFYAENYKDFHMHWKGVKLDVIPETGKMRDVGKLMPQGLNEAILLIRVLISLELLKDDLDKDFKDMVTEKLLNRAAYDLFIPEVYQIHNKPCWVNCTLASIGLYTGNQEIIDFAYDSEMGLNQQLIQGVTDDKFWYEGSIHYNYFLLEGLAQFLAFSKIYEKPLAREDIIHDMLKQGYYYAFDSDDFPNPNDGWPNLNLKTFDYSYAIATKVFGEDSELGNIYKNIIANPLPRGPLPLSEPYYFDNKVSLEHLMCVPNIDISTRKPIERKSICFKTSYFAQLKNKNINVFMKYGHASPSHSHPDKMNIEVMIKDKLLTRDISNTGYASKLCDEWHRTSIAHNTVVADGISHKSIIQGEVLEFNDNVCRTIAKKSYEGIDFKRDVVLNENGFTDVFEVVSSDEHLYDYAFHSEAKLISKLDLIDAEIGYNENGYQHLYKLKKVNCSENNLTLEWLLGDIKLESTIDMTGKELFIAETFENPAYSFKTTLILREKATSTKFDFVWNIVD